MRAVVPETETTQTLARIRDQLRQMDIETDAQIRARSSNRAAVSHEPEDRYAAEFDALEMDRYSRMQELSRALAESVGDLGSLHGSIDEALGSAETLLQQQGRQTTELQQGLMSTLMVPFSRQEQRLTRVVRQTALENGRDAEPVYIGTEAELDRNVLERMTAPLEHLLRNAVVHGIEPPDVRLAAGKHAEPALYVVAFTESSFFPIPPDVMLAPMCFARPDRWLRYAIGCTIASVFGAVLGYAIGFYLFEAVGHGIISFFGYGGKEEELRASYAAAGVWIIFIKGLNLVIPLWPSFITG